MTIRHFLKFFCLIVLSLGLSACKGKSTTPAAGAAGNAENACPVKFDADSAFAFVEAQCRFGPRTPNSEAHRRCGDYLVEKFRSYGLEVTEQKAQLKAWDGALLDSRNIIASYLPDSAERVLLCAHWDCRPWCDEDANPANHRQPVMGANDGASGVAVMLELARRLGELKPEVGIDFICFDAEDYGRPYWADDAEADGSDWCLGSQHWAAQPHRPGYHARYGVLLDMVGGYDAQFHYEGFSMRYAPAIVAKVWGAAQTAGAGSYFPQSDGSYAQDDHLPLNETAGIATIDIIPYVPNSANSFGATWHTVNDTPQNISRETLGAVGQTMMQLLYEERL